MNQVTVRASITYDVVIGSGLIRETGERLKRLASGSNVILVSDDNVYPLYGSAVRRSLEESGFTVSEFVFPHGEEQKNFSTYGRLLEAMGEAGLTRADTAVALGGGVVGDMTGFAASTYQRGIRFVQIPTSLLADVDSSVGGKTAIDLKTGKNQAGTFYQPSLVLCDTDTLETLPEEEYRNGCAEIIKYGVLDGKELFDMLGSNPVRDMYEKVISRCVSIKRDYVEQDERDTGLRMLLNLGHTIGHAVEACSGYEIPHGQGVAIGLASIARASEKMGCCDAATSDDIIKLLEKYGLPTELAYRETELYKAALSDKKNTASSMRLIVPYGIGTCRVEKIEREAFRLWLRAGGAL